VTESNWSNWLEAMHHGGCGAGVARHLRATKHFRVADNSPTGGWRLRHLGHNVLRHLIFHKVRFHRCTLIL